MSQGFRSWSQFHGLSPEPLQYTLTCRPMALGKEAGPRPAHLKSAPGPRVGTRASSNGDTGPDLSNGPRSPLEGGVPRTYPSRLARGLGEVSATGGVRSAAGTGWAGCRAHYHAV